MESFILVSQSAQLSHYAALLILIVYLKAFANQGFKLYQLSVYNVIAFFKYIQVFTSG